MSGPNFKLYSETEKGSSTHLLDTKAFSKQVQNFRNSLIMTFNDSYQKGVTREVRRKFSELMVKYFRTNFKHLHNLNSIPNFMEGLRSTISIFVSEIKVNEETKLDDGILSKLFLKCRDLEKSLKNKLSTNLIDDTPRTFAKSFYEFHQEDHPLDLNTDELQ